MTTIAIVAIAKNEARYIREWIAFHLSLGVEEIFIYNNDSDDETETVATECVSPKVRVKYWPSIDRFSPQRSAYADGLSHFLAYDWVAFIDIDEFIVPFGYSGLAAYLGQAPIDAGAIAVNWRTFGDSGFRKADYRLVTKAFTLCGDENWGHNRHFKSIVRPNCVEEMRIHHPILKSGHLVDSEFKPFQMKAEGHTPVVKYCGIQINHYQVKSLDEYQRRMLKGNANFPTRHPQHTRDLSLDRFNTLNNNGCRDTKIEAFAEDLENKISALWPAKEAPDVV